MFGVRRFEFCAPAGPLRILRHAADDGVLDRQVICAICGETVPVGEIAMEPGPGFGYAGRREDAVSEAIARPRRLLESVRT